MSSPAARLGDMHICPMITPGLPPIPHVGGPILGACVPTVLIGNAPAAVMGDICCCVGPPDTIINGSTSVFIGGRPAARMGDSTAHGGTIVAGCPTVLIGGAPPSGSASPPSVSPSKSSAGGAPSTTKSAKTKGSISNKKSAKNTSSISNKNSLGKSDSLANMKDDKSTKNQAGSKEKNKTEEESTAPKLVDFYITDYKKRRIEKAEAGDDIYLVIETENMIGKKITITLKNDELIYEYQGKQLENGVLTQFAISQDVEYLPLKVVGYEKS